MRCERCQGNGMVPTSVDITVGYRPSLGQRGYTVPIVEPCPDCGGCGLAHCCDGLTAANETPEPEPPAD